MTRFLAIYYAPAEAMAQMTEATPEEQEAGMAVWMEWKAQNEDLIIDFGAPVMNGHGTNDGTVWHQSNKSVSGYSILQAKDLETLQAACKNHPHIGWHPEATIGIYPIMEM